MNFLLFILATIGMSHIVVDSSLFAPVREWLGKKIPFIGKIMDCYQCSGTWCGFVMGALLISYDPIIIFACGCAGSFLSNFAAMVMNYIEAKSIVG